MLAAAANALTVTSPVTPLGSGHLVTSVIVSGTLAVGETGFLALAHELVLVFQAQPSSAFMHDVQLIIGGHKSEVTGIKTCAASTHQLERQPLRKQLRELS